LGAPVLAPTLALVGWFVILEVSRVGMS
jgi:hypothetical protein